MNNFLTTAQAILKRELHWLARPFRDMKKEPMYIPLFLLFLLSMVLLFLLYFKK